MTFYKFKILVVQNLILELFYIILNHHLTNLKTTLYFLQILKYY